MKQLIKENKYFFIPFSIFILISSVILLLYSKSEIHIAINQLHTPIADFIFKYITHTGDGLFTVLLFFVLLAVNRRYAIAFAITNIVAGGFVQLLKNLVFDDVVRPRIYFENSYQLFLVEGVTVHGSMSFPSGHTTIAFTMFLFLSFYFKQPLLKFLCFTIALLAGYSRMYLSQHFLIDVYAGSLLGVLFATAGYMIYLKNTKTEN